MVALLVACDLSPNIMRFQCARFVSWLAIILVDASDPVCTWPHICLATFSRAKATCGSKKVEQ
jgi:hypothetical protein